MYELCSYYDNGFIMDELCSYIVSMYDNTHSYDKWGWTYSYYVVSWCEQANFTNINYIQICALCNIMITACHASKSRLTKRLRKQIDIFFIFVIFLNQKLYLLTIDLNLFYVCKICLFTWDYIMSRSTPIYHSYEYYHT